ncbi:MAG: N-acetylmuramoyl-L-alanine amidase, partial [bacterium]
VPNKQEIIETTEKIEVMVADAENEIEKENEEILETKLIELEPEIKKNNFGKEVLSYLKTTSKKLYNKLNRKVVKYFILPLTVATTMAMAYQSPKDWINMGENYAERHMKNGDDPNIVGINSLYSTRSSNTEKSTYDFLGENKIDYKGGYYMTSVFDLTDQTPPEFKVINDREFNSQIDSAAGITTNLFEKFSTYSGFTTKLTGHENKYGKEKGEIPVIAYNKKTRTIKAGHFKEFNEDWMVSETYEIPVNFKLNQNGTLNLMYHENALRMVPYTTNEAGKQIPFPVGVSYDKNKKTARPSECTHFGTLEGGKVIFVCGEKQIQVNGSFADMYKVYERLQNDHKNIPIHAYLLDNGAYNLPIWNNTGTITPNDIKNHMKRHRAGGTALVLINNNKISPYEYKNHYKEIQHYTKNFTIDQKTKKPIINEKSTIVLHHTGIYENPNDIIGQFQDSAFENSAHVLIMKDGTRHLFNTDDYVMAHAGKSEFHNRNAVNYFSLGIELEGASTVGQFSVAQLESLLEYLRPRIEKYHIPLENITTHKIIRNNYIKKHPNEKVLTKNDLDDKVWE